MRVEIVTIPDCPNTAGAGTRVRAASDEARFVGVSAVEDFSAAIGQRCETKR